jgi:hypothetical protein
MHQAKFISMKHKKIILLILLMANPVFTSVFFIGCDDYERPVVEIISQETLVLEEGNYTDVLIEIQYGVKKVSALPSPIALPFTPLYAYSPAPPRISNRVTSIKITSDVAFDVGYPAGADVISYFNILDHPTSPDPLDYPLAPYGSFSVYLKMNKALPQDITAVLTITCTFENGLELTSVTEPVTIQ